ARAAAAGRRSSSDAFRSPSRARTGRPRSARVAGRAAGGCSRSPRRRAGARSGRILQAAEPTDLLEAEAAEDRLGGGSSLGHERRRSAPYGLVPAGPDEGAVGAAAPRLRERRAAEEQTAAFAVRGPGRSDRASVQGREER